jgi:hypothetical protein
MNQEALLARAVPRRCVRPPPNKSAGEFRSVGKTQSGLEHLARVRERQRDFSLVMQQLEESTETALATAAPVRQREEKSAATARAPAHTSPAAGAASSPVGALPRKASPRQVRRNVAACETRRTSEFVNPSVMDRARVCVDATTLRTVGSIPGAGPAKRQTGGEDGLQDASLSRSQSAVHAFQEASRAADVALYRVLG